MSKYIALPKGISEAIFDKAIAEFKKILGAVEVLTNAEQLGQYTKTMLPVADSQHLPSAVILARSVEQIQKILAVCNRWQGSRWTISTGKNMGYRRQPSAVGSLDLRRMNKIIEVNAVATRWSSLALPTSN
jgi:4-cresol dehydrogenase (hydroxylating)